MAVLFRINAQSEAFEEALAARGIPYVIRGAARFFDRPEVREAVTRIRGAARSGEARQGGRPRDRARHPGRDGLDARGAVRARPDPRPLGVLAGAGDQAPSSPPPTARSTSSSTTSTAAPPSSTPRSPTASRSPPSTPPRGWSGTPSSSAASRTAPSRSPTPRRPPQIEEERRLLYVGMTRARIDLALSWASGAPARAVVAPASPRGSSTPLLPAGRAAAAEAAPQAQGRPMLPRVRQAAADRRREGARPLRRLPGVLRRGAVRAAPRVAHGAGPRGGERGVHGLQRRHAAADRRADARSPRASCCKVSGVGKEKLQKYGEEVLELVS